MLLLKDKTKTGYENYGASLTQFYFIVHLMLEKHLKSDCNHDVQMDIFCFLGGTEPRKAQLGAPEWGATCPHHRGGHS